MSALQHGEARTAAILEAALDAIVTIDHRGTIVEFNPAAERTFGHRRADVLGRELAAVLVPPALRERHRRGLARQLATGESQILGRRIEVPALHADGTEFPVEVAVTRIAGEDPPLFTAYLRDITERRHREERRNARLAVTQLLAEAATAHEVPGRLLQAVCEALHWEVGIFWAVDGPAGVLRFGNAWHLPAAAVAEFVAASRGRAFSPGVGLPGRVWDGGRPVWVADVQGDTNFPRGRDAARVGLHGAFACPVTLGGRVLGLLEFFSRQLREPDADLLEMMGTVGGQVGQFLERLRAEEALRQRAGELAEADRRKDEFLAMLSHELRNPLAPIRNALQLMRLRGVGDPVLETARAIAERQTRYLARLVDDLLDISRISRGKLELRKERVELSAVARLAVDGARPLLAERQHHLTVEAAADPLWLEADPVRLEQVFTNLLNNAAKYTDPGGRLWLATAREGDEAVLRVRDTGIGIPPEMLGRVFDLFAQADRALGRAQGGLGIGLALVKGLVEVHGGTVGVTSGGVGRGSEFTVRLPLAAAAAGAVPPAEAPAPPPARARRVLVVDDNRDGAESLALLLRFWGHEALLAHDGPTAVVVGEAEGPDVVLCDIGLPGMDGYQVAQRLRERLDRRTTLVALTGYGQDEDRRRSRAAGFDHHLTKPVDPEALRGLLAASAAVPEAN